MEADWKHMFFRCSIVESGNERPYMVFLPYSSLQQVNIICVKNCFCSPTFVANVSAVTCMGTKKRGVSL